MKFAVTVCLYVAMLSVAACCSAKQDCPVCPTAEAQVDIAPIEEEKDGGKGEVLSSITAGMRGEQPILNSIC